jgi:hypothetical protein
VKWLETYNIKKIEETPSELNDFRFISFENKDNLEKKFSILSQFYLKLGSYHHNSQTTIFIKKEGITSLVIQEILLHFNSCRIVTENNVATEIIISNPKNESLEYINSQAVNPIIHSLFSESSGKETSFSPSKPYIVIKEFIEKYEDEEFDKVYNFLKKTTINNQLYLNLFSRPLLNDSVKDFLFIRYLAYKQENLLLWIEENDTITSIQF